MQTAKWLRKGANVAPQTGHWGTFTQGDVIRLV